MKLAILGGAGLVGRALSRAAMQAGHEPVCIDRVPCPVPGVRSVRADLLQDDLESALSQAGADRLVHLVARVDPPVGEERDAMRRLHVDGTRRLVQAAVRLGLKKIVLCSSAVVYGAWPDNPVPMDEQQPVRPRPEFPYGVDKAAQEDIVQTVRHQLDVAIGRPAIIYGPDAKSYLTELIRRAPGVLPAVDGRRPALDFIHVNDVASGLLAMAAGEATGVYNLATDAWLEYDEAARLAGLRVVSVPRLALAPMVSLGARFAPASLRAPAYVLDHLTWPFVLTAQKLRGETGWKPAFTAAQAVEAMLGR